MHDFEHSSLYSLGYHLFVDVSGQAHDDWWLGVIFFVVLNDFPGSFQPVHLRHVDVHKDQLEVLQAECLACVEGLQTILRQEGQSDRVNVAQLDQRAQGQTVKVVVVCDNDRWGNADIEVNQD